MRLGEREWGSGVGVQGEWGCSKGEQGVIGEARGGSRGGELAGEWGAA